MRYLITGANRGIGLEFVEQLLKFDGVDIVATARSLEKAEELQKLAESHKERLTLLPLDIDDLKTIDSLGKEMGDKPIDVLINNAGRFTSTGKFPDVDFDDMIAEFTTNTIGTMRVAKALLSNVEKSERKVIVNMSTKMASIADNSSGGHYAYRVSKTALNMATRSMARDLEEKKVIVVAMHPGWVQTRMGGENAPINTEQSVTGMLQVIEKLTLEQSGHFIEYSGKELPW